jgi:hypothetical protein
MWILTEEDMNTETELLKLFETWRSLSSEEGKAIGNGDWVTLAQCQNEKRLLQDQLAQAESRVREESGDEAAAAFSGRVREVVQELVAKEKENLAAVSARRREAEAESGELNRCSRALKKIHGAYSLSGLPQWHSYS